MCPLTTNPVPRNGQCSGSPREQPVDQCAGQVRRSGPQEEADCREVQGEESAQRSMSNHPLTYKNICSILLSREPGGTVWAGAVEDRARVGYTSSTPGDHIFQGHRTASQRKTLANAAAGSRQAHQAQEHGEITMPSASQRRDNLFLLPIALCLQSCPRTPGSDTRPRRP